MNRWFLDSLHKSEWLTVYILGFQAFLFAVQAVIFFWQGRILGHHGEVMEGQQEISKKQAETAELIGKALDQQSRILAEQLELQKRLQGEADRTAVLEQVGGILGSAESAAAKIRVNLGNSQAVILMTNAFPDLHRKSASCARLLGDATLINSLEREAISRLLHDVDKLELTGDSGRDIIQLEGFNITYKDFMTRLLTRTQ